MREVRKWQPTPVFLPGESQGWGAWWAAVYGVAQSRTRLKQLSSSSSSSRSFRYDLNQIPYDYTVEVRNRFKGLDLTDRVPDELWMEAHDICTGIV